MGSDGQLEGQSGGLEDRLAASRGTLTRAAPAQRTPASASRIARTGSASPRTSRPRPSRAPCGAEPVRLPPLGQLPVEAILLDGERLCQQLVFGVEPRE